MLNPNPTLLSLGPANRGYGTPMSDMDYGFNDSSRISVNGFTAVVAAPTGQAALDKAKAALEAEAANAKVDASSFKVQELRQFGTAWV